MKDRTKKNVTKFAAHPSAFPSRQICTQGSKFSAIFLCLKRKTHADYKRSKGKVIAKLPGCGHSCIVKIYAPVANKGYVPCGFENVSVGSAPPEFYCPGDRNATRNPARYLASVVMHYCKNHE